MDDRGGQFGDWMRAHLGVLHRISRAFAEPADQHDLLQELMIAVWKAQSAFRGDSSPVTFIWKVAHNRALTWRRRESGRTARDATTAREIAVLEGGDDGDSALLDRLYAAIRKLGPLDRSIVLLSLEGAALAVALGQLVEVGKMTPGNVRDGAILFGGVLAPVWGGIAFNYFTRLKPEGARLQRLLAEYAS